MISTFKKLVPAVAVLTLIACGSTPKTTSYQNAINSSSPSNTYIESGADTKLFAQLIKVKDGYEFKRFSKIKPSVRTGEPWVQIDNGIPLWDIGDREDCVIDNLGISKNDCDIDEKLFINTSRDVSGTIVGGVLSMGLLNVAEVKFDKDFYLTSYQNALNKLAYNDKIGVEALRELPNMVALLNEFYNSKSKIASYQDAAISNNVGITSLPNVPNYKVNTFANFSALLLYINELTEYSNSVSKNLDTIHQEVNQNLIAKIALMTERELFDWINTNYHKQYVSQTTRDIAANRSNKLALQTISEFNSYQEAEQWIQFRSRATHFEPETVSAANKQFLKLFNESYVTKAKSAKSVNDYRYIINVYGIHKDKLHSTKYLEFAKRKVAEYSKEQELLAQKRAEQQRLYEDQKRQKFIANVKSYRNSLSEGQDSHCGLIVEVKDKVVRVETMVGLKFFKREQLYPAGVASCSFRNNVYQPPQGMGV